MEMEIIQVAPNLGQTLRRGCKSVRYFDDLPHDTLKTALVPLDNLLLSDAVRGTDPALASATLGNTLTWTGPVIWSVGFNGSSLGEGFTHMQQ